MAPGDGVPESESLINQARSASSVSQFVGAGAGGVFLAVVYLIVTPIQAAAAGAGAFVSEFLTNLSATFNVEFIGGFAGLLSAGQTGTAAWLSNEALGFIIAFLIVLVLAWLYSLWQDLTDMDVPFLGNVPFFGPEDAD